ncbi:MAG: acetylxylan esterase [Minicystis sp.]
MIRRHFLSLVASAPLASCAANVPTPPPPARDYRRGLPDHLRSLAARAADARRRALDDLTTVESVHRRQTWARSALWRLAGGAPDRTSLSVRTTGEIRHPDYRVEKLVYESRPGLHVPALLYLPISRSGPVPGVLFQAGHLPEGKGAPAYQRACQALVKLGLGVLSFDPVGQGERRPHGSTALPDDEHDRIGQPLLLSGDTMAGLMLWDAVRSLDVLASRPEIDPHRLGAFGHSGGGTMTMFLSAVDDRLAAAALSCANTENVAVADFDPPGAIDDAEQDLPGAALLGFDRWDTLYPLAPKPLLVLVSTKDPFSVYSPNYLVNGREELERLKHVYDSPGLPDTPSLGRIPCSPRHLPRPSRRGRALARPPSPRRKPALRRRDRPRPRAHRGDLGRARRRHRAGPRRPHTARSGA